MKSAGVLVLLGLCVTLSYGSNEMTKAIFEAREKLMHSNPQEIVKNMTSMITSALPEDMVQSTPHVLKDLFKHFIRNVTDPENMRVFLRLVKESKMKKKGEIIRMTLKFMNPENLRLEGLIHTFQSLDETTISELAGITLEYIKEMAPQFLGSNYATFEKFFNLINPEDVSAIAKILFNVFKETNADDVLWFFRRVREEIGQIFKLGTKYMVTDTGTMVSDFQTQGKSYLQDKARVFVHDVKKFANFEKFSPHTVQLTRALKTAAINLANVSVDEIRKIIEAKNITKVPFNITSAVKGLTSVISQISDFIDLDDIGPDVENAIVFLKKLNQTTALHAEKELFKFLPNVDNLVRALNGSILLKGLNQPAKSELIAIVKTLNKIRIPDNILDFINGGAISALRMVDEKVARGVVEFFIRESRNDNPIYRTFKAIVFRNLGDYTDKFYRVNLQSTNWDEFKGGITNVIKLIDEKLVNEMVHQILTDFKHLDSSTVSDMVSEVSSIASALISQDWLERLTKNPMTVLETVNKTTFTDLVTLNLNAIRLINETQVSFWCKNFASLASDELDKKVEGGAMWFKNQFERVENGHETARMLKVNETTQTIAKIVKTMDMKQACDDMYSVLRLNRVLGKEARQEVVNLLWSVFYKAQRAASGDVVNQQMIQNLQEILNALLRVLIRVNNNQPSIKSRSVRMIIRSVDDFTKTGKVRLRLRRTAKEVQEDNDLYERMSKEAGYDDDIEFYDMSDTIIPFDPNVRYRLKVPYDTMVLSNEDRKINLEKAKTVPPESTVKPYDTIVLSSEDRQIDLDQPKEVVDVTQESTVKPEKVTTSRESESSQIWTTESVSTMKHHYVHHTKMPTPATTPVYKTEKQIQYSTCSKDVRQVIMSAWESQTWARKMFEGWLQLSTASNTSHSGIIHQCLSIDHPTQRFAAQFCAANITMPFLWPGEIAPEYKTFPSGVCMPSTCNPDDFGSILKDTLQGSTLEIMVQKDTCQTSNKEANLQGNTYGIILLVIVGVILASSLYDVFFRVCVGKKNSPQLAAALSLKSTGRECFSTQDNTHAVVHGLRAVGLAWALASCSVQCIISAGIISKDEAMDNIWLTLPLNLYAASDVLLFTGGVLAALSFQKAIDERGELGVFTNILNRLFTWVPCIAVVILVRNGFFSTSEKSACSSSWWQHLLFIQNFMAQDKECLPQGWYLSLEMQLFLLTPLVLFIPIATKRVKWIVSFVGSAVLVILPVLLVTMNKDPLEPFPTTSNSQFEWDVVKPYTRFVPWIIGIVVGEIMHNQKSSGNKVTITERNSMAAMVCCLGLIATCAFTAKFFTYSLRPHWQIAVYLGISHLAIALSLAVIALLVSNNVGGWVKSITACGLLNVLGRLSFSAYLVHMTVVCFKMDQSYAKYMDNYSMWIGMIGDYTVTQVAAAFLCLFVELPLTNIWNMIYKKYGQQNSEEVLIPTCQNGDSIRITTNSEAE